LEALIVVDMQEGLIRGAPKHDLPGVVRRINRLAERVRQRDGSVFFVQHDGRPGEEFAPSTSGWALLRSIDRSPSDKIIRKTLNDSFFGTSLRSDLKALESHRVLVAGWATDFCVDATIRSAVSIGFEVVAVADAHTLSDRPHLKAEQVIEHHHWIWANLIGDHPVSIAREADI